ncbi:MAG: DNA gyrase modulator, partial [Deltaproteobacteria bacterium]
MNTSSPADIADKLLALAKRAGADQADVLAVTGTSVSVSVRNGALDEAERSEGTEVGLRAIIGQKQATVSTSDLSDASLERLAERAVDMARLAPDDATIGLADPAQLASGWDSDALQLDDPAAEPEALHLQALAMAAEAAALGVQGVSKIDSAGAGYGRSAFFVAASNGFRGGYARTGSSLHCTAISGDGTGMERDYAFDQRVFAADMQSADEIGRKSGERAVSRGGPRKAGKGAFPVLYDERVASGLIGHVLSAINGASIVRG